MRNQVIRIYRRLADSVVESLEYAKPKVVIFGVFGVVGYPLYYLLWTYLYPQPYENLWLRMACAAVALPMLFIGQWPERWRIYLPLYWYLGLVLCVPTFFTYMALHNGFSVVWATSAVAAIVLVVLVMDAANALVMMTLGTVSAFVAFSVFAGKPIPWDAYLVQLPIQLFALVAGAVFNLANERERRAKQVAAMAFGGQIAHELGTPLQSIRLGARAAMDMMPALTRTCESARSAGLDVPVSETDLRFLTTITDRIDKEVDFSLLIIDMMLTKAGSKEIGEEQFTRFGTLLCVESAIERYAFKSEVERSWVKVDKGVDFQTRALELMFVHVLFNLLKNSLYAVRAAHRRQAGEIRIWAERGTSFNRLYVKDNGAGIPEPVISRIFDPFFTTQSRGTGLGLHFCKGVMHRFGGDISCRSQQGEFTEFTLSFPVDGDNSSKGGQCDANAAVAPEHRGARHGRKRLASARPSRRRSA